MKGPSALAHLLCVDTQAPDACPLNPSQIPWMESQAHGLRPGQSATVRWVLGHQNCSILHTELILLASPPSPLPAQACFPLCPLASPATLL